MDDRPRLFLLAARPVLASGALNGTLHEVMRYARALYVLSAMTGRALLLPDDVTVHGVQDGTPYTFTRTWTRFVGVQEAVCVSPLPLSRSVKVPD